MIVVSAIALVIWIYLLFFRGHFWRLRVLEPQTAAAARVVAVIPARNESQNVGRAVSSLLRQELVDLTIVLIDDGSTDGTAEVATRATATAQLTVVPGSPLPPGWTGKLWAVEQGIQRALEQDPDFILLTDADIEHDPQVVASLVQHARDGFDLVSYMVKLRCESMPERLLIPAFVYFFFQLYPPAWIARARMKTAGAAGGCMLISPEALRRAGGIAAIRGEIIDDCALARAVKGSGGRVWLGPTDASRSLRSYGTFAEIGRMIARTAFNQLRHSTLLLLLTIAGLLLTYIAPIASVVSGQRLAMILGGTAWAFMTASYVPTVRFYRLNPLWSLTLPLAALFYAGATVWSAVQYWSGRGGQWKGRHQDVVIE
ncbi:MAG: glycosyltransferase [Terriglobales bacterium]